MKIYETEFAKAESGLPTNYQLQKILYNRRQSKAKNTEQENSFRRVKKGVEGEEVLLEYLRKYGGNDWVVVRNVWLNAFGNFECDLILLMRTGCYVFEVKNYDGVFSYEAGICRLNGREIGNNCVAQIRRARLNLEQLFKEQNIACQPRGVLAMVGQDNPVKIFDEVEDVEIFMLNELRYYIQDLFRKDQQGGSRINVKRIIECLELYEVENPFLPKPVTDEELSGLRKGICCRECGSFDLRVGRFYVTCECGFQERRERAIVRTIGEYGTLCYDRDLRVSVLYDFFGGQISRSSLQRTLERNFEIVYKSRYSYYLNKK